MIFPKLKLTSPFCCVTSTRKNMKNNAAKVLCWVGVSAVCAVSLAAQSATIVEYPAPTASSMPLQVGVDALSNVWFGEFQANKIVYRNQGVMYEYSMAPASGPMDLWVDPRDNSVWYSAIGNYIAHTTTAGKTTLFAIPSSNSMPMGVTGDSQGNIWFAEMFRSKIGVVHPNGSITEYKIPTMNSQPTGLTVDANDNVWFCESTTGKIGVRRATGQMNEYTVPGAIKLMGINYSSQQKTQSVMWFTDSSGNKIGSISQTGQITQYTVPTASATPQMIWEDIYGNVWFSEKSANKIGQLLPNRSGIVETSIPTANSQPMGLAVDPNDQTVWFAETTGNNLGHLIP